MSWHNKVVWSEGMFLRPQHFQQQDRYVDYLVCRALLADRPYAWGFASAEIDRSQLEIGKFALPRCQGAMPDGTVFSVPDQQDPPPVLDLTRDVRNQIVYLAMPIERSALAAVELGSVTDWIPRYQVREVEVYDTSVDSLGSKGSVQVGRIKLALKLEGESRAGYHCIPLAQVSEVHKDRKIRLNENFIPACIDHRVSAHLTGFVRELQGLVKQRADELAQRVSTSGRGSVAEVADFLLLQVVNRIEPVAVHIDRETGLHPEVLYRFLLAIAGELATFTTTTRRAEEFAAYNHDNLMESFLPVEEEIRRSLLWMREPAAIAIPVEDLGHGMRRAVVADRALLQSATFILEVAADMEADSLMREFRQQSKLGPRDKIRELVMQALPGVPIRPRPTAPRQIPYHINAVYFEIDTSHDYWRGIQEHGMLALHVAGTFPNLTMTLWALKPLVEQGSPGHR